MAARTGTVRRPRVVADAPGQVANFRSILVFGVARLSLGAPFMATITPCRALISDRFPVASFAVNVAPDRLFEIACATHPALLRGDHSHLRTPGNFFTSRMGGLLRAPAGHATYLVPSDQLRRFAGQPRLYYAVGSYRDQRGADARFSAPLAEPQRIPFIQLSSDFSGKTLDRGRIVRVPSDARYGAGAAVLTWGGDQVVVSSAPPPRTTPLEVYDDGFSPDLWTRPPGGHEHLNNGTAVPEPARRGDAFGGEPPGFEDAPALRLDEQVAVYGGARPRFSARSDRGQQPARLRVAAAQARPITAAEPAGVEHPPVARPAVGMRLGGSSVFAEPSGTEHPIARPRTFGRSGDATLRGAVLNEPLGSEDAVDLRRRERRPARYGQVAPAATAPAAPTPSVPATTVAADTLRLDGVDDEFDDRDDEADPPAPVTGSNGHAAGDQSYVMSEAPGVAPLTIAEKYQLVLPVAQLISGPQSYSAVNADAEFNDPSHAAYQRVHYGLEWGFVLLSQRSGALGRALEACQRRDAARFSEIFGPASAQLLSTTTAPTPEARLQPVDGAPLWQEPWLSRFRAGGEVPAFRAAQNEVAIEGYLDPNLAFAIAIGFDSDRALAMLFDRCIQMGNGAGPRFIIRAVSPLGGHESDVLDALGFATVQAFQESVGLSPTGRIGTRTSAALIDALRRLGGDAPIPVPPLTEMLDRLVEAARGRRFARRVATLRTTPDLSDLRRTLS